jgi:hypothetical protein
MKNVTVKMMIMLAMSVTVLSCGTKKEPMLIMSSTGNEAEAYKAGFGKYFDVRTGNQASGERYLIFINQSLPENFNIDANFVILLHDYDKNGVNIEILYTIGAESEKVTVVNPNFTAGEMEMTVSRKLYLDIQDEENAVKRIESIAAAVFNNISEIERKNNN